MRIFLDIGHPAHVHYFRHFIKIMKAEHHDFFVSARDKEVTITLLKVYEIEFYNRGTGSSNIAGKFLYLLKIIFVLHKKAKSFKPDIFISFASPYLAIVSRIYGKPHISFTDTENAILGILSFAPFTKHIITPNSYKKTFGHKHIKFKGFMELCYLHPNRYEHYDAFKILGLERNEPYVIFRFVSWDASHDIGQFGFTKKSKIDIVNKISKRIKIFISAEGPLPEELEAFRINISPEKIHSVLDDATLFIGEGATMASECAMLGTPAIYVNSLTAGTIEEQEKYGLIYSFRSSEGVLAKIDEILCMPYSKDQFIQNRDKMLAEKIDVTEFMKWFIINYPASVSIIKNDPYYQMRFK